MDRSAPKHLQRARRAAPGHHDPACTGAATGGASAAEIRDGLVLAFLARKRLLVLLGDAGSGRPALFRQLVEHVEADGAMALPVTASVGVQVEDLITAAGTGALPDLATEGEGGEPEFDALIGALEDRLELAGAGLLAVDNATVLAPPVLADLVELTRAETPAGRFLQVLLCGTPELEGTLARAGLADVLRDTGVIYRLGPDASIAAEPFAEGPASDPFTIPIPAPAAILAAPQPAPEPMPDPSPAGRTGRRESTQPANDWAASFDWSDRGPDGLAGGTPGGLEHAGGPGPGDPMLAGTARAPRRTALYAGAALTTLVLLGAAGAAIATAVPGATPDKALAMIGEGWSRTRDAVERTVQGLVGDTHRDAPEGDALALGRKAAADTPPPAAQPTTTQSAALTATPPATPPAAPVQTAPVQTAALPPATTPPAATPAPADPAPTASVKSPAASGSASGTAEAAPGSASLPPLEEPSATPAIPAVPQTATPAADTAQRVRALADQARRQIAGKRLTTPPGDNAYETVQRLRQIAPTAPEAGELLATMTDTYRRWGMLAERDGDWSEAKRFYERAQMVSPGSPDLAERIRAATEQRAYTGPAGPAPAGGTPPGVAPAAPADAAPGLQNRESVLALLRNPAELARTLQGGTSPDTRLDSGKTLLMIAAEQGLTDAVRVLLDRHARTDLRTADGATAVMYAAWGGHDGVVKALADGGADLDATNSDGKTALMAAAARGHEDVARTLIQRGVAVDRATAYGWSALMYAANNGHEAVAKLLVDRGANPYRMDTNGNSALTLGALQGHVQVVEALKPR
ncbi:ankyrin repeat domain-containing protein [Azospirillum sp. TSO35-2]|uniref:ankyrin repeat domain-containing protein n=1 Tax=Azospirillum sp. TSO35-2 TaxID=716796 RepID=UPI000D64599E|nr:ankyrin repeat domain-containing protein [Azospirillum sp. TSO35-2]